MVFCVLLFVCYCDLCPGFTLYFFFVPKCQYVGSGKYRFGLIMFKQTLKAYFKGYWPVLKEMM